MIPILQTLVLFSVILPAKMDFAPNQPLWVTIQSDQPLSLILTDLGGKTQGAVDAERIPLNKPVDLRAFFPTLRTPGAYMLRAVPPGKEFTEFVGTPIMITVQTDPRQTGSIQPMIYHVDPLVYAELETEKGPMTMVFYYDAAPHTIQNFITLAQRGFYDGLTFYRLIPHYLLQTGDPTGSGTGGPGYMINAEFSAHAHRYGVVSMARTVDPNEKTGALPRDEFADSAGSQFFIVLTEKDARRLDERYTIFGRIVLGLDTLKALSSVPMSSENSEQPASPPVIHAIRIHPVTADHNPYQTLNEIQSLESSSAATLPISVEAATQPIGPN